MDFRNFDPLNATTNNNGQDTRDSTNSNPNNGAAASNNNDAGNQQPVVSHNLEHTGVVCDTCNKPIRGFRYKCLECPDFDLCCPCEVKGYHAGHVMMRICFPEQARGAIKRFARPREAEGLSTPPWANYFVNGEDGLGFGIRRHKHHGHGRHGGRHHMAAAAAAAAAANANANEEAEGMTTDPEADGTDEFIQNFCPYKVSKRGIHKWSRCMQKARRRAAAHAALASVRASASARAGQPETAGASATAAPQPQPFDLGAAAAQLQEFLNAVGLPIDVVDLYNEWGNAMGSSTEPNVAPAAAAGNGNQNSTESTNPPTSQMQNMNLNNNNGQSDEPVTAAGSSSNANAAGVTETETPMDSEWTILDNDRRGENPGQANVSMEPQGANPQPSTSGTNPTTDTTTTASAGNSFSMTSPVFSANKPPTGGLGSPLYPSLNSTQIKDMIQGVTSAVGSAMRQIPIVTDPSGGMNRNAPSAPIVSSPGGSLNPGPEPVLDARCTTTLNQLLAMGFSNQDGWLSRLILAKNGELEAVLNSLFPTGSD